MNDDKLIGCKVTINEGSYHPQYEGKTGTVVKHGPNTSIKVIFEDGYDLYFTGCEYTVIDDDVNNLPEEKEPQKLAISTIYYAVAFFDNSVSQEVPNRDKHFEQAVYNALLCSPKRAAIYFLKIESATLVELLNHAKNYEDHLWLSYDQFKALTS